VLFFALGGCKPGLEIQNPYSQVDWQNHKQYKANLHTHTTRSDGSASPQSIVDNYYRLGYSILAITDHNEMTYPWVEFASMEPSPTSKEKLEAGKLLPENLVYENRNPDQLGMVAIQGSEISSPQHLGCYFSGYSQRAGMEDSVLNATASRNGLVIFNHPGRYSHPASWYTDYFQKYNHIVGLEVFNQGNRCPNDRITWDSILVKLMPERPVWGFANDDLHGLKSIGRSWNIFILPNLSAEEVRRGMENGLSFFVYSPEGHAVPNLPRVESVKINERKGLIGIESAGADSVHWISQGKIIYKGQTLSLKNKQDAGNYVRAELFFPGGIIVGTQPFGIKKR